MFSTSGMVVNGSKTKSFSFCVLSTLIDMKSCFKDSRILVLNEKLNHCLWEFEAVMGHRISWDMCPTIIDCNR